MQNKVQMQGHTMYFFGCNCLFVMASGTLTTRIRPCFRTVILVFWETKVTKCCWQVKTNKNIVDISDVTELEELSDPDFLHHDSKKAADLSPFKFTK